MNAVVINLKFHHNYVSINSILEITLVLLLWKCFDFVDRQNIISRGSY